jgi:hypothetical protein
LKDDHEWYAGKDFEGDNHGLFQGTIQNFPGSRRRMKNHHDSWKSSQDSNSEHSKPSLEHYN